MKAKVGHGCGGFEPSRSIYEKLTVNYIVHGFHQKLTVNYSSWFLSKIDREL